MLAVVLVTTGIAAADDHVTHAARRLSVADASLLLTDASTTTAVAPSLLTAAATDPDLLERRWPTLPADHAESEEDVIVDHLSALGNQLAKHMTVLSDQMIGLKVDGRAQTARLRVGTGTGHYLAFKLDSDWYFSDGKARINAKVHLALGRHEVNVQLPAMEMEPTSYHGDDGVMLKLPLFERRF